MPSISIDAGKNSSRVASRTTAKAKPINLLMFIDTVLFPFLLQLAFFGMFFGNTIDVSREIKGIGESQFNFQILYKLGFMMLGIGVGGWGWWFRKDVRFVLLTLPGLLLIALGGWHFATIPMALIRDKALISCVSYFSALIVTVVTLMEFGMKRTTLLAIAAMFAYSVASIGLYVVAPELATFKEVMNDVVTIERFSGLAHPNFLGRYATLTMVLSLAAISMGYMNWRWFIPLSIVSIGCLIASLSRTPVIAGAAAIAVISIPLLKRRDTYMAIAMLAVAVGLGLLFIERTIGTDYITDRIIEKTTKTGSSEEIKTGTGRTEIWKYSIEKSAERPFFGWGMGSTSLVMEDQSGHSHNILLHPILALGLPGGVLVGVILTLNLAAAYRWKHPILQSVIVFIVVLGLIESPLLGPFPDGVCMLWFTITILPILLIRDQANSTAKIA
jgi:exopolysaccharide production protein ExoQ